MNDCGPAFPTAMHQGGCDKEKGCTYSCPVASLPNVTGMSLRQWYAGTIALTQFDEKLIELYRTDGCPKTVEETIEYIATLRGRHADALIAVLTERGNASEKSP